MYCVLSIMYCVLCIVYYVLCIMHDVLCSMYDVWCIMYYVLCTTYCVLSIMYYVVCVMYYVLCICISYWWLIVSFLIVQSPVLGSRTVISGWSGWPLPNTIHQWMYNGGMIYLPIDILKYNTNIGHTRTLGLGLVEFLFLQSRRAQQLEVPGEIECWQDRPWCSTHSLMVSSTLPEWEDT